MHRISLNVPSEDLVNQAKNAVRSAGELLKRSFDTKTHALTETARDIKTQADIDAHNLIVSTLEKTRIPIISEESENHSVDPSEDTCWIIDPLDGTVNFFRGSPLCCTSIGLWSEGAPAFGLVYDFLGDELFSGGPNIPTDCNGKPSRASGIKQPDQAIIATGFPNGRSFESGALKSFLTYVQSFRKVRFLGSAALSLAWLADGRLDAYSEEDIYLWDVAAGLPLVLGAGGLAEFSSIDRETMRLNVHAVASSELQKETIC